MTSPELVIRTLGAADLDAALALCATLPHAPHWPRTTWRAMFDEDSLPRRIVLSAWIAGQIAGLAVASLTPPEAELESIAVATSFQRQGIATALFEALSVRLRANGIISVVLEVRISNTPAQALYGTLGFTLAGRRPGYYVDPPEDALVLLRSLV